MKRAVVTGASGLVGAALVEQLIAHPEIGEIISLVRKPGGKSHAKLTERVIDFDQLPGNLADLTADCAFCCLGTTLKTAGSKERQYVIDHDYVVHFAEACRIADVPAFAVVSSLGASTGTANFYLRTKGEMERDCIAQGFSRIVIVRPSLLLGNRVESRFGEKVAAVILKGVSFLLIGTLRKYRGIPVSRIAARMIGETFTADGPFVRILESDMI